MDIGSRSDPAPFCTGRRSQGMHPGTSVIMMTVNLEIGYRRRDGPEPMCDEAFGEEFCFICKDVLPSAG